MTRTVHVVAMVALLALAGCSGLVPDAGSGADEVTDVGRMNFYISDQEQAIEDFEHANVTVDAVAFKKADSDAKESDDDDDLSLAEKRKSDAWVVRDIDERTVDLTELKGQNAAKLVDFDMEAGSYDETVVHVSDMQAVKKSGGTATVKVEDGTLEIDKDIDVDGGSVSNYVFDMTIVDSGSSDYDLEPVEEESGTDVEVKEVADLDEADDDDSDDDSDSDDSDNNDSDNNDSDNNDSDNNDGDDGESGDSDDDSDSGLSASFTSDVKPGQQTTVKVTDAGGAPVQGATVVVNDQMVGMTNADGTISFQVPQSSEELEIEIEGEDDAEVDMEAAIGDVDAGDTDEDHEDDSDDSDGYDSDDDTDDIESNDVDAYDADDNDGSDSDDSDDGTDADNGSGDANDGTDGSDDSDANDGTDTSDDSTADDGTSDDSTADDGTSDDSTADDTTTDDDSASDGTDDNTTDAGSGDDSPNAGSGDDSPNAGSGDDSLNDDATTTTTS